MRDHLRSSPQTPGPYRHVRHPIISSVDFILLGSWPIGVWFCVFLTANVISMSLVEEPALVKRFGDDCRRYRENVPRWIPRLKPWNL